MLQPVTPSVPSVSSEISTPAAAAAPLAEGRLLQHSRRVRWGLGTVVESLDDRVTIIFQDGRQRTFKRGYYHLIEAVDRPYDQATSLIEALLSMVEGRTMPVVKVGSRPISLEEQCAYLRSVFAGGFQDDAFAAHHRGDGRRKPLRRHRDALLEAGRALGRRELRALLDAEDHEGVHRAMNDVLATTDLVGAKERAAFRGIDPAHHARLGDPLFALLHGQSRLSVRVDAFLTALSSALGATPSWNLATVFLAAVHPEEHLVVRPKIMAQQARWMAPGLRVSDHPVGLLYERLLDMALRVRDELRTAGFAPRDLLDVVDFMHRTLRPLGRREILDLRARFALSEPAAPADAVAA